MMKIVVTVKCDRCSEKLTWKSESPRNLMNEYKEARWTIEKSQHLCHLCALGSGHGLRRSVANAKDWDDEDDV